MQKSRIVHDLMQILLPILQKKTARYKTCSNCLSRVVVKLPMTLDECRSSEQTFSMPLKVKIQLLAGQLMKMVKKLFMILKNKIFSLQMFRLWLIYMKKMVDFALVIWEHS